MSTSQLCIIIGQTLNWRLFALFMDGRKSGQSSKLNKLRHLWFSNSSGFAFLAALDLERGAARKGKSAARSLEYIL